MAPFQYSVKGTEKGIGDGGGGEDYEAAVSVKGGRELTREAFSRARLV